MWVAEAGSRVVAGGSGNGTHDPGRPRERREGEQMPFSSDNNVNPGTVCRSESNFWNINFNVGEVVDCARCGDFHISHADADYLGLPFDNPKQQALASHVIRKMFESSGKRVELSRGFFDALKARTLPTPAEVMDNLIAWIAEQVDGKPGDGAEIDFGSKRLLALIGARDGYDAIWAARSLKNQRLIEDQGLEVELYGTLQLTPQGWRRFEELKTAHVASRFAFFARQFNNPDLDHVFKECLRDAVQQTGYELRTVSQQAGLIDAIIEDEIRRCRFLIADLSDNNGGAYWEAGFAEGLGKPVIYICKDGLRSHFDTDHRHTVKWNLSDLSIAAAQLKAVIRNTLLGDAKQAD
jgi:hypothetical protein